MNRAGCDDSRYLPIGAYAIIGDSHTAALVSTQGSIDWHCPRRFDAPAVFCRILDAEKGGYFSIAPADGYEASRRYQGDTNILETTFTTGTGKVRVTDAMAIFRRQNHRRGYDVGSSRRILRLVEGLAGEVELELRFKPTFNFARSETKLSVVDGGAVAEGNGHSLSLACPGLTLDHDGADGLRGRWKLAAGERQWVVLTDVDDSTDARSALAARGWDEALRDTREYWENWSSVCSYRGPYRREVMRSALALKLLIYEPTGAIVAAPTTSIPEVIGGVRNWDYRFSWLRDSSLILYALMALGYQEEAKDFFRWLHLTQRLDPHPNPQILYTIDAGCDAPEADLHNLEGYRCSQPVRVGNKAAEQVQLDIYGEVLAAAHLHYRSTLGRRRGSEGDRSQPWRPSRPIWGILQGLVGDAARRWQEPDNGLWESRGGQKRFLYSRLMCWVALDRGIRLAEELSLPAPMAEWKKTREEIRRAILTQGYDERQGAFVQAFGSSELDASVLAIPRMGFLPFTDPRVLSTVERIRQKLTVDGLVLRYRAGDGLPGKEGAFTLATFWLVDNLALSNRLDEAHDLFERVIRDANDVGLMSEEVDPRNGELLGNFPQGFTHMALVGAAIDLAKAAKHGAEEQAENEAERAGRASRAAEEGCSARHGYPRE